MKLSVSVKPNAKKETVRQIDETHFEISTNSPATEGKANMALITLLAKHFDIPKLKIKIVNGLKSKKKIVKIL